MSLLYRLEDVAVDEKHRGQGLGKALTKLITDMKLFKPLLGLLSTKDASGLYEQFGFKICEDIQMYRLPDVKG